MQLSSQLSIVESTLMVLQVLLPQVDMRYGANNNVFHNHYTHYSHHTLNHNVRPIPRPILIRVHQYDFDDARDGVRDGVYHGPILNC
ncbi:MAG: hypothetical protein V3S35_02305 [Nitrosomonadaceae bacterium]